LSEVTLSIFLVANYYQYESKQGLTKDDFSRFYSSQKSQVPTNRVTVAKNVY